jgi:AbrB family looped-hinge helix DNA binding protein
MRSYTTATIKGQVLIPVALRRKLGIKAGVRIEVFEEDGRIILQPVTRERIQRVRGMFKGAGALDVLIAERKRERERENGKTSPRLR